LRGDRELATVFLRLRDRRGPGRPGAMRFRLLVAITLALFALLGWSVHFLYGTTPHPGDELSLDQVARLAGAGQVQSAVFLEEDSVVTGTWCAAPPAATGCTAAARRDYWAPYLHSDAATPVLLSELQQHAAVSVDQQQGKALVRFLAQFLLPLVILASLFALIFLSRSGGQGSISEVAGFGSIGRQRNRRRSMVGGATFADVAGAEEAVTELREVVDYLRDPQRYQAMGAMPPKGVLLFGPPGCGKTLLARAVAGEARVPFFAISGAEFVESLVGVGAARVRDLFRQARRLAPAIVFIDELDAAGRRRGAGGGTGGGDEREQTLNQMLVAMDGFDVSAGVVVMGATNRPDILDPALLRPGRFDRHVTVDEPDLTGRLAILELHARNRPVAADVDFAQIAQRTSGFTGADLANVVNEATLLALREEEAEVRMPHLTEAIQRVLHGPRRRGRLLTGEERRRIAFHEAGHALVAATSGVMPADVARLSVVARGRGLGASLLGSEGDRVLRTRSELEDQLAVVMGGVAAEEVIFGEPSTGAEDDIAKVTDLARQIVGRYGMSPQLGSMRIFADDADVFLGGETAIDDVSSEVLQEFYREVRRLIDAAGRRARDLLLHHRVHLEHLADTLLEFETLEGDELEALLLPVRPSSNGTAAAALGTALGGEVS